MSKIRSRPNVHPGIPAAHGSVATAASRAGRRLPLDDPLRLATSLCLALVLVVSAEGAEVAPGGAPGAGPAASLSGASRLVILVRDGKLARDEVSPGSSSRAVHAWKLAVEGVALPRIDASGLGGAERSLDAIRAALLPAAADAASGPAAGASPGTGETGAVLLVDLRSTEEAMQFPLRHGAENAEALKGLEALFGSPPPPRPEEEQALARLRGAVARAASDARVDPGSGAVPRAPLDSSRLAEARVALIRVLATGDGAAEVGVRDELLGRMIALAGSAGHVIVVNLPTGGEGSALLRGPLLAQGRILGVRRPIADLSAITGRILGAGAPGSGQGKENLHGAFR